VNSTSKQQLIDTKYHFSPLSIIIIIIIISNSSNSSKGFSLNQSHRAKETDDER
jgi:hypothetical protein